jgi:hypothetical protein
LREVHESWGYIFCDINKKKKKKKKKTNDITKLRLEVIPEYESQCEKRERRKRKEEGGRRKEKTVDE